MKTKSLSLFRKLFKAFDQIANDQITVYASQAAFFLIISAIPLLMMVLNVIQFVSPDVKNQMIHFIQSFTPKTMAIFIEDIINELYNKSSGTLFSFTALVTLWSGSRGIASIERGLNNIYKDSKQMNFIAFRLMSTLYTIIFLVIFWLFLIIMMFGTSLEKLIATHLPILNDLTRQVISIRNVITLLVLIIFFVLLYGIYPGRKLRFFSQIPGALFATIGWIVFSYGYSYYINNFSNYSYMYGSLTAVVLLLLWVYFCMIILLLGAEVNLIYPKIKKR